MKKISILLLSIGIMNLLFGCSTSKQLAIDEVSSYKENKKDFLIVKAQGRKYVLNNFKFLSDHLKGDLSIKSKSYRNYFLVSAKIDFEISSDKKHSIFLRIPYDSIEKITYKKTDVVLTVGFWAGISTAIYFGLRALKNSVFSGF